jgi:GAF domain-containing protein
MTPQVDERAEQPDAARRLDEVIAALADMTRVLAAGEDLLRALQRNIGQLASAVPGASMTSVTVLRDGGWETVAASSGEAWAIDQDQYAAGDGPCLEAARTSQVVRASEEQARRRWPGFTSSARTARIGSYLSAPLLVDDEFAGSLNLYSEQQHGFADFDVALLRLYVMAAAAAIASSRQHAQARQLASQLSQALDSRAVIDQAIGVLMARDHLTPQQAFAKLSRQSQNTNTKLREVAAGIISSLHHRPWPDHRP